MTSVLTASEATAITRDNVTRIIHDREEASNHNLKLLLNKLIKVAAKEGYNSIVVPKDILLASDRNRLRALEYDFLYYSNDEEALAWTNAVGKKHWRVPKIEDFAFKKLINI